MENNKQTKLSLFSPIGQTNASGFCSVVAQGIGYLPSFTRFLPPMNTDLRALLVPTADEISRARPLRIYGEKEGLMTWTETESEGINQQMSNALSLHFDKGLRENGKKQLATRGLGVGIVKGSSYEDFHCMHKGAYLAILEIKSADGCILHACSQAVVTATNMQLGLLNKGVSADQCIVPVIASTGLVMTFGVSVVLSPSFPTYIPLSKQLDLSDPFEREVAAAYLVKAITHARELGTRIPKSKTQQKDSFSQIALCLREYYCKELNPIVSDRGLGLFDSTNNPLHMQPGFIHMFEVLNKVYASESARGFAEYPLAIRTPDEGGGCRYYSLIYRDLTLLGYKIGTPNRVTEPDVFEAYRTELRRAVDAIHAAGVIHVDLYSSNVMFRVDNVGNSSQTPVVSIKIIDWDGSHCLNEGHFAKKVEPRLSNFLGSKHLHFGIAHDINYVNTLFLEYIEDEKETWTDLASGDKTRMDGALKILLQAFLRQKSV
jgi:hypothetical protein